VPLRDYSPEVGIETETAGAGSSPSRRAVSPLGGAAVLATCRTRRRGRARERPGGHGAPASAPARAAPLVLFAAAGARGALI